MKARLFLETVVTSIVASVAYGLVHDQITIRICPEYFTIWHPHVIDTDSLTVLALVWGVIATWWVGLILGIVLGFFAVYGSKPVPTYRFMLRTILLILGWTAVTAIVVGIFAWITKAEPFPYVIGADLYLRGEDFRRRFGIDLYVHNASYFAGLAIALVYGILVLHHRGKLAEPPSPKPRVL